MIFKIIIIALIFLMISCDSGNSIDPNVKLFKNFMPLEVGNYWVYNAVEIDQNGNELAFTKRIDSFAISESTTKSIISEGKVNDFLVYKLDYYKDKKYINSTYYHNKSGYLSMVYDKNNFIIDNLEPSFAYLINQNSYKWNAFKYSNNEYDFVFENEKYKSVYDVTVNSESLYSDTVTVPAGNFIFYQYSELIDSRLMFDYKNYINSVRFYKIENTYRFAESVGMIYHFQKPTYQRFMPVNPNPDFPSKILFFNGLKRELVRYKAVID